LRISTHFVFKIDKSAIKHGLAYLQKSPQYRPSGNNSKLSCFCALHTN